MPPLEGDEEVKEVKGLNFNFDILTPNKLLTRLSKLIVQIKAGNNSNKFKKQKQTNAISFLSTQ